MRKRNLRTGIDVTPLVDVLLILLVIVLLAMPSYAKRLPVDLPKTSLAGEPVGQTSLKITISKDGGWGLDGVLPSKLSILSKIGPQISVELAADKSISFEVLARAIEDIQARNPKDIALITH